MLAIYFEATTTQPLAFLFRFRYDGQLQEGRSEETQAIQSVPDGHSRERIPGERLHIPATKVRNLLSSESVREAGQSLVSKSENEEKETDGEGKGYVEGQRIALCCPRRWLQVCFPE